jgi:carboxyl-terminal processing protease
MQNLLSTFGQEKPMSMPNIGAWFKKSPDGYTVQMLLNDSPAEKAGIRKGDVVSVADGAPFMPVDSLRDKSSVKLTLKRDGKPFEIEVKPISGPGTTMFADATRTSARVFEQNGKKIGYFHIWTMAFAQFRDPLLDAMEGPLKDTDALILDVRDGFGGRPEGFGDPFFPADKQVPWLTSRSGRQPKVRYDKPMVVLINDGSRSAKEVFAFAMKKNGRATLIGSNTAGNVLGTSPLRLNDWSIIEIPSVPVIVDGVDLERKGVAPDIAVDKEFDATGKDLYIERALKHLAG